MEQERIDAVLTVRSAEDGFYKKEILELLEHLQLGEDEEVDAVYLEADSCILFGFIRMDVSDERLGFAINAQSAFGSAAIAVANNSALEHSDCISNFAGIRTMLYN